MSCPSCGDERIDHYSGKPWWIRGMGGDITYCPSCGHKLPIKKKVKRVLGGVMAIHKDRNKITATVIAVICRNREDAEETVGHLAESYHDVEIPYDEEVEE